MRCETPEAGQSHLEDSTAKVCYPVLGWGDRLLHQEPADNLGEVGNILTADVGHRDRWVVADVGAL